MLRHPDLVTVGMPIDAHLLRRLDAVASDLGLDRPDALHAALLCWLEQEERKTAVQEPWGATASQWRDQFLAAGQAGLKSRAPDARDEEHQRLHAKVGELLMENELLYAKVDHLEAGGPLARRRSTR